MKLETFQEKKKKKVGMIVGIVVIVMLLTIVFVYRTYSIYQERQEFDVIKGSVPDQNYDIMFLFYLVEENGTKSLIQNVPDGKDYRVNITCNNEASGFWDYESWGPVITNLNKTRTRCNVTFYKLYGPLKEYGIGENVVVEGNGLYEVPHEDANITYTTNEEAINNLKMTEYRYAGENPNNYVTFNEELWRIIGLVNTPEGQRIKVIRYENIGWYSWDSSVYGQNNGWGVNEWSDANIMKLYNPNYEPETVGGSLYYNRQKGTCYNAIGIGTTSCDFSSNGLTEAAKKMIDSVTWNIGTNGNYEYNSSSNGLAKHFYNYERSNQIGKLCSNGAQCNDNIIRTFSWKGQVGLMYPSDYGYATSGGTLMNRDACLNKELYNWSNDDAGDCKNNNWLYTSSFQWTIMPCGAPYGSLVFHIASDGSVYRSHAYTNTASRPSLYLLLNVKIIDGNGTKENPYILNF